LGFLERLSSKAPISNFMEILPVGAVLIYAGRWKLIVALRDLGEGT
jgi:hypothetical protein